MPTISKSGSRTVAFAVAAGALAAACGHAVAQDALGDGRGLQQHPNPYQQPYQQHNEYNGGMGDGRALDASLSPYSRYNAPRQDFTEELRFRNAVATGNAPGGLSFRGDVGYVAPFEFRGELGSDDLYAFRRDSLYSGLAGMGIRGTEAVQYQMALTTGARPPLGVVGSLVVPRDPASAVYAGAGPTAAGSAAAPLSRQDPSRDTGGLYDQLRSTGAYTANRPYTPFLLTTIDRGEDLPPYAVTATPLRGLKATTMDDPGRQILRDQGEREGMPGALAPAGARTAYDEVLRQIRERAESNPARLDPQRPDSGFVELAQPAEPVVRVPGQTQPATQPGQGENAEQGQARREWEVRMEALREQLVNPPAPAEGAEGAGEPAEPGVAGSVTFDPRTMELIRPSGVPVAHLVDPDAEGADMYVRHVRAGERLMAAGQYFDAEERFTSALSIRPGDVTAQVGRVHAQLGAGMLLSAGLNLRTALLGAPPIAGTRYAEVLLPAPERTGQLLLLLRENAGLVERPGAALALDEQVQRESALLLAYLGYQLGDREAVEQGLAAFKAHIGPDASGRPSLDQRLAAMLEQVWLGTSGG